MSSYQRFEIAEQVDSSGKILNTARDVDLTRLPSGTYNGARRQSTSGALWRDREGALYINAHRDLEADNAASRAEWGVA